MNFYIVYCKSRRKFDKYVKVNCISNKVIVDVGELMLDFNNGDDEYFNLMVFTRIKHSIEKMRDVYFIPNVREGMTVTEILKLGSILPQHDIKFNSLLFYNDFKDDGAILEDLFDNIPRFNSSQIIQDY